MVMAFNSVLSMDREASEIGDGEASSTSKLGSI
jgi:hypothetical protein